jgi:predicted kinase
MMIVMSGLPGTGKSTIAMAVARSRRLPVLSVDPIESSIVRAGVTASFETGLAAYLIVETIADACLTSGLDPVIDAVISMDVARDMWRKLAHQYNAELRIIECVLADEILQERLNTRQRDFAIDEPSWSDVERRRREWSPWPEPHLTLDAAHEVEVNVKDALAYVASARARAAS